MGRRGGEGEGEGEGAGLAGRVHVPCAAALGSSAPSRWWAWKLDRLAIDC